MDPVLNYAVHAKSYAVQYILIARCNMYIVPVVVKNSQNMLVTCLPM